MSNDVAAKKLDKWAELLLDTGKRNNLINFKDSKSSTAEVLMPSSNILFDKFDGNSSFEIYDPKIDEDNNEQVPEEKNEKVQIEIYDTLDEKSEKEKYFDKYSPQITKHNQLLIYNTGKNPITAVKKIDKKAKTFIEETGVNVAYIAFGFINWKESDSSDSIFHAPVLLIPIQLIQNSAVEPYYIKSAEDDIIVNPTFVYKMDAEYGIELPEYKDEGLTSYLESIRNIVSKLQWTVTSECKIGIFSFLKINMYRDLKDNAETILSNNNVRELLGEPIKNDQFDDGQNCQESDNPLIDFHCVVDADSSQLEAIEMAKSGKSFVLQGPPGTGKSQTITNIIAECLDDGKKILFVSEKLAALTVVYDKLEKAGLKDFCLQLHSHKANKKEVIADICNTLKTDKSSLSSKAKQEIEIKEKSMHQLDTYAFELHRQRPVIEKSLYDLYESYAPFIDVPDIEWVIPDITSKGNTYLTEVVSLLDEYVNYEASIGYDYKKNPWYGYINQDISYQTRIKIKNNLSKIIEFLENLSSKTRAISEQYKITCNSITDTQNWIEFFKFASESQLITPSLLEKKNFDVAYASIEKLKDLSSDILTCKNIIDSVFNEKIYELNGKDYHEKLVQQFSTKISRIFNKDYKNIKDTLHLCKKGRKSISYSDSVILTERLAYYQQKADEYKEIEAIVKNDFGPIYKGIYTDWENLSEQMNTLKNTFNSVHSFGNFINSDSFSKEDNIFKDNLENLDMCFNNISEETIDYIYHCFDTSVFNIKASDINLTSFRLKECLKNFDMLDNWCHFRNLLSELNDYQIIPFLEKIINQNIESKFIVDAFKKQFYFQWIDSILSASPSLSSFSRISQDKAVDIFREKDKEQFEINKAKIRADLSAKRPNLDMIAPGSSLSILLREGEKKRKQKSVRKLLSETGKLIQEIKPCFLMSPLSVSTFLAPDSVHFDIVIFDEASQIFPQDAIGAIYRADQLIVVGDSKQMPPSNFFNSVIESDDNDDDETEDVTDFESILDLCSTTMQQIRLRWHYRSHFEQLIAFSNKNFYDNELITFPSSSADKKDIGVDYYHVDGIFDRKAHVNEKEAEFVVDLVYKNLEKYSKRSLGVVAFSVAQQDLIENLLAKRRQEMPEKEYLFKKNEKEPFFIKNLETVQGDERDTIIFSVAYGIDASGKLLHNFGPLNRIGGERRLNVAVTRAKCNVQIVSSMHYTDIDLKRTSSEGARLLREYLDFAENGDDAFLRSLKISNYDQFDSGFEEEVCNFLRSNGFSVDTQVGCSGFKIDMGLRKPNSSDHVLAIECDGATYHSSKNARDRDRLRQEILEGMGWKFYRIWSTDWFKNKSVEKAKLLEVASNAIKNAEYHIEAKNS